MFYQRQLFKKNRYNLYPPNRTLLYGTGWVGNSFTMNLIFETYKKGKVKNLHILRILRFAIFCHILNKNHISIKILTVFNSSRSSDVDHCLRYEGRYERNASYSSLRN